jgi:hypothetical protein
MVLGKAYADSKNGGPRLCEEGYLVWRSRPPVGMVPCGMVTKGPDKASRGSLQGCEATEQAQTGLRADVLQGVICRRPRLQILPTIPPQSLRVIR